VALVELQQAIGELDRVLDVAFGERGIEGEFEQLCILWVRAQASRMTVACRPAR